MRSSLLLILAGCGRFGFDASGGGSADPDAPSDPVTRITIQHGMDDGTVVGPNGFTCTTGTCVLEVPPDSLVNLRGLAPTDAWFAGWTGPCGGNFDCDLQATADVTIIADFTPTPNRVFVTSTVTDGLIGGVAGADAICAQRATAGGLSGNFVAYLSDSTTNAASRVATSRGWVRTDGAPFADAPTAFTSGAFTFPARLDEFGNDLGDVQVFTGTSFGSTTANLCIDWTSNDGANNGTTNQLKYGVDSPAARTTACSFQGRLLCTEIGRVVQVTTRPDTGRKAFMTSNGWVPGGGRASADALCASEAMTAGVTGNFLAAIATTTESIKSRFSANEIYRRIDGVRLLRGVGLFDADWVDVSAELDQYGDPVSNDFWTGATRFNAMPTAADNCSDWTDSAAASSGYMHWSTNSDVRTPTKTDQCNSSVPVLCLEN